jgi:hypothetical protein
LGVGGRDRVGVATGGDERSNPSGGEDANECDPEEYLAPPLVDWLRPLFSLCCRSRALPNTILIHEHKC